MVKAKVRWANRGHKICDVVPNYWPLPVPVGVRRRPGQVVDLDRADKAEPSGLDAEIHAANARERRQRCGRHLGTVLGIRLTGHHGCGFRSHRARQSPNGDVVKGPSSMR